MIRFEHVTKVYPGTTAVDDLSFTIEDGEFTVLIGPSGCGKSTTLRMINRLIPASSGTISIDGQNVADYRPEALRRSIGYAIQSVGLFPHNTVAQNIAVVPQLLQWDRSKIETRVDELLDLFGLEPATYRGKRPRELSGGEAQRVGVARALAADPAILLMDEPFGAIDPITRETLQTEFARIQRELRKTIVFVTHDIDEAIRLASRIVILKDGRLVQHATPEDILTSPADKFVLDFIGADRALKRLSRLTVQDYSRKASSVPSASPLEAVAERIRELGYLWVTDASEAVAGWLDEEDLVGAAGTAGEAMTAVAWRSLAVMADSTLKEALSRMVQQGIMHAPVVDAKGRLLGEIRLSDILDA